MRRIWLFFCAVLFTTTMTSGQPGAIAALSEEDRQVLGVFLGSALKERQEWTPASTLLLDSTPPVCGSSSPGPACLLPSIAGDLQRAATMQPDSECERVGYRSLSEAFVGRNMLRWRVNAVQAGLRIASAREVRSLAPNVLLQRFGRVKFLEVSAPGYSADRRFALVYVRAIHQPHFDWSSLQVLERGATGWTPVRCGVNVIQ